MERATDSSPETFTVDQTINALKEFLRYAEAQFGKSQQGYFSGPGWAARCVRAHIEELIPSSKCYKLVREREKEVGEADRGLG